MPAIDDLLADLAAHPPSEPTPVEQIRGRAVRRVRRRRALVTAVACLAVVAAAVGVAATAAEDPGEQVAADGTSSTGPTPSSTTSPRPSSTADLPLVTDPGLTLDPATGHEEGMAVRMALIEPASGPAVVAQCAVEAQARADGAGELAWCTGAVEMPAEALRPFTLARTISTPDGAVDCAEAFGRCTLDVMLGGADSSDDRLAPLAFAGDQPAPARPAVEIDGDEGTVGDGDTLLITVTGVERGDPISVQQCSAGRCDVARDRATSVQAGPETQLTFTAFHDVYVNLAEQPGTFDPGWTACVSCEVVVRVGDRLTATARRALDMEPTDAPIRPSITIDPPGPHRWGDAVTVRAAGLQPSDTVPIGWCPVTPPQGGGGSACWSGQVDLPREYPVGADGTVVVEGFALPRPESFVGTDCSVVGACGVGVDGGVEGSILAIAPLDLGG